MNMASVDAIDPSNDKPGKTAAELETERQIESLAVPGYDVLQDGVFTVIKRTTTAGRSDTFPARIYRWLCNTHKWAPMLSRFVAESIALSPWRFVVLVLSKLTTSLTPSAKLWITGQLLAQVELAVSTGVVNRRYLALLSAAGCLLSTGLGTLDHVFARNAGILERYFESMVTSRLLKAYSGLDYQAVTSSETNRIFMTAARTINSSNDQAFTIISDVVKCFTSALEMVTQGLMLRQTLTRRNVDLIGISVVANFVRSAEWLFRGDAGVVTGATNKSYLRMQSLWNLAWSDKQAEPILLNLPSYYSEEYDKADKALGEIWTYRLHDKSHLAQSTAFLKNASDPLIYALFALRAAARRGNGVTPSSGFSDVFSMGSLSFIQDAASGFAGAVGRFMYVVDDVRQHCSEIVQFYRAFDVKPALKQPNMPTEYETQLVTSSSGAENRGMHIRLDNVSFAYPGSERLALKDVSFELEVGTLTCIVGYNGGGKSTLISLICRLVDPSQGQVFINGHRAQAYRTRDLHDRIACQFQETPTADVTLREFLHMGDIHDDDDEEKMLECIRIAGIEEVIKRFPKGLDARLGPYPADDTPVSLLRTFVKDSTAGNLDPWENGTGLASGGVEGDDDDDDECTEVVGGAGIDGLGDMKGKECAFSPGQWQKLCFARTLMKRKADLRIFDEASASLDPLASRAVFDKIESLRGSSTVVHITHDLAACIRADKVIMFEDGQLIETGTHAELVEREGGKYRAFYLAHTGQDDDEEDEESVEPAAEEDECESEEDGPITDQLHANLDDIMLEAAANAGSAASSVSEGVDLFAPDIKGRLRSASADSGYDGQAEESDGEA